MPKKALLFLNGEPPIHLPNMEAYDLVACTDGSWNYLRNKGVSCDEIDILSGDFDSVSHQDFYFPQQKIIPTLNQDKTDFHKGVEILVLEGVDVLDVYGASGREQDHYLGNLHTALLFQKEVEIVFYDEFCKYFFAKKNTKIVAGKGSTISLMPFPIAQNVTTKGLRWSLCNETLDITKRVGTRNIAEKNEVEISFTQGNLLVFCHHL